MGYTLKELKGKISDVEKVQTSGDYNTYLKKAKDYFSTLSADEKLYNESLADDAETQQQIKEVIIKPCNLIMKYAEQPETAKEKKQEKAEAKAEDKKAKQLELDFSDKGKEEKATPKKESKAEKPKKKAKPKAVVPEWEDNQGKPYPTVEVSLLKRFISLNCKTVSFINDRKNNPKSLLNSLQSAIISKKIRKSSEFADEIMQMQKMLIQLNTDIDKKKITGKDVVTIDNADKIKTKLDRFKEGDLCKLSKRFVNRAQHKEGRKAEAVKILKKLQALPINEAYEDERKAMINILSDYANGKTSTIDAVSRQLRGLGRHCNGLGSVADENGIVSSEDVVKATFDSAGFTGRWASFFGNPSSNFKIMVYGAAGGGKSTFCILLAKYLTEHLGWRVLYIASEERFGYTLKEKLKRLNACNENLHIAESVPDGALKDYDCVFFDSVNDLQIEPSKLNEYTDGIASVSIFQCTKDGQYKGGQEFSHDADVVVRVDDMVAVTEKNRFGNSGNEFVVG